VLSGPLLDAWRRLDLAFLGWARALGAEEHRFPAFLSAAALDRLDYFRSFPHLVTFPVSLDPDPARLRAFAASRPLREDGSVDLGPCAPVRDVLTPAACYHFYVRRSGARLDNPLDLTTVAACWRREERYEPLRRQWCFTMREIVRIGTAGEVQGFLDGMRASLARRFEAIGLPIEWRTATDSFFDPSRSAKFLAQTIEPVKTEMVFGDDLAIGSINFHRNFFGETFDIARDDRPAFSGCVAFGVERWLYAFLATFGEDPSRWPLEGLDRE